MGAKAPTIPSPLWHRMAVHHPTPIQEVANEKWNKLVGMVGIVGFEPTTAGVKVLCLSTWRYPNITAESNPRIPLLFRAGT